MKDYLRILFLVPYPLGVAPSQRFRFEQYLQAIEQLGWQYELVPFMDKETWDILYKPGHSFQKVLGTIKGFIRRVGVLARAKKFDYVFIHREAVPLGPPVFEWLVSKVLNKKIIYDFDDAIWMADSAGNNKVVRSIKSYYKVNQICRWAYKVSCGNKYLQNYALKYNSSTVIIPTTIDTINLHNSIKDQSTEKVVIGWTGTHTTLRHLDIIFPVLKKLEAKYKFEFCVISNKAPDYELASLRFVPWQKKSEVSDLLRFNVGVMPLVDDPWANGKCAFKALQYMSLGVPALVSPVGMNKEVVQHGVTGYICTTEEDWYKYLELLINDADARTQQGKDARRRIEEKYSVKSNTSKFIDLFS